MNKIIKKLIKRINKEECPDTVNKLLNELDAEVLASYNKTSGTLRTRDEYEDFIYNQVKNKISI
jgi:hypothetical protein